MKVILKSQNQIENYKKALLEEYRLDKVEQNIFKRIDVELFFSLIILFFFIYFILLFLLDLVMGAISDISVPGAAVLIVSILIAALTSLLINWHHEKNNLEDELRFAERVTDACHDNSEENFLHFLKNNFYDSYCIFAVFMSIYDEKWSLLSASYSKQSKFITLRCSENGLVNEYRIKVDNYEERTDIENDELIYDEKGVTYRQKYELRLTSEEYES